MSEREGPPGGHGPSVVGGPGAHHDGGGPPPRSPARFVGYVLIFVILVGVSLFLRASHNKHNATATGGGSGPAPASSASGLALQDTAWSGQACRTNSPKGDYTLRAAYDSTEGTVNAWVAGLSAGEVTQTMTGGDANVEVAVCYIDGPWQLPPDAQSQLQNPGMLRALVLVPKNGTAVNGPIGPAASFPLARPVPPATIPSPPAAVTATGK